LQYVGGSVSRNPNTGYYQANGCFTVSPAGENYRTPYSKLAYVVYNGVYYGNTTTNGTRGLQTGTILPIGGNDTYPSGECGTTTRKGAAQVPLTAGQFTQRVSASLHLVRQPRSVVPG
jgi:hypothetical protein